MSQWRWIGVWMVVVAACEALTGCSTPPTWVGPGADRARIDARTVLLQATESQQAAIRAHALEALSEVLDPAEAGPFLVQALDDEPTVRYAAAIGLGDMKYAPARQALETKATSDTRDQDKRVYCATIYALFRLGDPSHMSDLATMLTDTDPMVRATAARVMGKTGEQSAVGPIKGAMADEPSQGAKYSMLEALAILGDPASQVILESYTKKSSLELCLPAIDAMGAVPMARAGDVWRELQDPRKPALVRLAAAGAMGRAGFATAQDYDLCVQACELPQQVLDDSAEHDGATATGPQVRAMLRGAMTSLGWMNNKKAVSILGPFLSAKDDGVRLAAATSILRLLPDRRAPLTSQPAIASQP